MKSILDVQVPDITTYCYYGSLSSILKGQADYQNWFSMNFISLRMNSDAKITFDITPSPIFHTPWTKYYRSPRDILSMYGNSIIDFIIKSINSGYYVMVKVNRYYIKCNFRYMESNNDHEIFVYGYDLDNKIIYVCDNLDRGRFVFELCEFEEFENAFLGISADKMDGIIQVKIFEPHKNILFDKDVTLNRMENYLTSKSSVFEYAPLPERTLFGEFDDITGIAVMSEYINVISENIEAGGTDSLDLRNVHLLREHKSLLLKRTEYFEGKGYIFLSFDLRKKLLGLIASFDYILLLAVKHNHRKSIQTLKKIHEKISHTIPLERQVLNEIINQLTYC